MVLNLLLLIPVIGAIIIAIFPVKEISVTEASQKITRSYNKEEDYKKTIELIIKNENSKRTVHIKNIALITSVINFIISLYL